MKEAVRLALAPSMGITQALAMDPKKEQSLSIVMKMA